MYKIKRKVKIDGVVRTIHCKVIPEKQMVIAEIRGCEMDAVNAMIRDGEMLPINPERFAMQDIYSATAVCHAEDTFDPEVGADVAIEKLSENYCVARTKKMHRIMEYINGHLTEPRFKVLKK